MIETNKSSNMISILLSLLLISGTSAAITNYTQNGITIQINDQSNGAVSFATIQNQANLFFQYYPQTAANYQNAPSIVLVRIDPTLASNSLAIGSDGFALSASHLESSPNDLSYMQFAINTYLGTFYSTYAQTTTTTTTTTTTPPTTTQAGTYTYTQNGITLILLDQTNGQVSFATIQNQATLFFASYPQAASQYSNAPTTVTVRIDPTLASNSVAIGSNGFGLSAAHLQSSPNDSSYMQFAINAMLSSFFSTNAPGSSTTTTTTTTTSPTTVQIVTTTTTTPAVTQGQTIPTSAPNTWTQGGFTLIIKDNSNGQVPAANVQNQAQMFFALYPSIAAEYVNAPKTVTLTIDPTLGSGAVAASSNGFSLSVQRLASNGADGGYMEMGFDFMLNYFFSTNVPITTPANPSAGYSVMTDAYRQTALNAHNQYRSTVALGKAVNQDGTTLPTASNMYKMTWSKQVEADAQAWANQCNWTHYMPPGSNEGQNMFYSGYVEDPNSALVDATNAFYAELAEYGINKSTLQSQSNIGHFTQLAWSTSNELGCGIANCSRMINLPDTGFHTFVVCNYRAQGNIVTLPIYTPGNSASNCTQYSNSVADSSSGLCVDQSLATIH